MNPLKIKSKSKFILVFLAIFLFVNYWCAPKARAEMWGTNMVAAVAKQAMEKALTAFKEAMISNLKMQATRLMNDRIMALVTGRSAGSLVISDYGDFIYGSAQRQGQLFSNDLFASMSSSASRATNDMMRNVETAVNSEILGVQRQVGSTIDDYVSGGIDNLFDQTAGGGADAVLEAVRNPYNNVYGTYVESSRMIQAKMNEIANTKGIEAMSGQGFASRTGSGGLIDMPGSILKDLTSTAKSMPMRIVAAADSVPQIAATMASNMISGIIESEVGKVTRPIDSKLTKMNQTVRGGVNKLQSNIYNGVKFSR
jgi:hypothetical protein